MTVMLLDASLSFTAALSVRSPNADRRRGSFCTRRPLSRAGIIAVALLMCAAPSAWARDWAAQAGAGVAMSNAGVFAPTITMHSAREFSHLDLGLRGLGILGGTAFSGWFAAIEAGAHTGAWLGPVRVRTAFGAGIGREIAASPREGLVDAAGTSVESGKTGGALTSSAGLSVDIQHFTIGLELTAFYWTNVESRPVVANGGLGGALAGTIGGRW